MAALSDEIHDCPLPQSDLDVFFPKGHQFCSSESASEQDGDHCYVTGAIEAGGKSKETIRSEFLYAHPDAAGKSTFQVFFSDVTRPFGSASVSRSIRLETDAKGRVSFDPSRVPIVKSAIAKGLVKELGRADKGPYPKKDSAAIEEVLRRFGVPLANASAKRNVGSLLREPL